MVESTSGKMPPFLHSLFTGDANQTIYGEIVSFKDIPEFNAADLKHVPADVLKQVSAMQDMMVVMVKLENNAGFAVDTIVSLKGQKPKVGELWEFKTPYKNSTHPVGERADK